MFDWLRARLRGSAQSTIGHGLTLVSNWLATVRWIIDTKFIPLAQQAYGINEVVYACIRLLSQSVPEAPLVAYRANEETGDKDRIPYNHPLSRLIKKPNRLMTEYEFWELTTIHMAIVGRSTWWKQRNNLGEVMALWPLRPDRVGPLYSDSQTQGEEVLRGWIYQVPGSGVIVELKERDVLAFNFPDPTGESGGILEGFGPVQALARQVAADNEATKFVGALLANYAAPTVALKVKRELRDEQEARLVKAHFRNEFGGANRGTPALLDAETEVQVIGFNLQELEFPELREIAESRIASTLGVPAILVGIRVGLKLGNNRASITEQRAYFAETTLSNYWRRYQDQYSEDVAREFGEDIVCEFDTAKVRALAGQIADRLRPIRDAFEHGGATRNEYRHALGLPAVVDGNIYLVPQSMVESPANDQPTPALIPASTRPLDEGGEAELEPAAEEGPSPASQDGKKPEVALGPGGQEPVASGAETVKAKEGFGYGSTQFDLPAEIAAEIIALGQTIPDEDLAADGREDHPHVTVKYGVKTPFREAAETLRTALIYQGPMKLHFGRTSVFENENFDVVWYRVESDELMALHDKVVEALDCVDTQSEYVPHATVAYVKKGLGAKYAENDRLYGLSTWVNEIKVCAKGGEFETVALTHEDIKAFKAAPDDPQTEAEKKLAAILGALLALYLPQAVKAIREGVPFDYQALRVELQKSLEGELVAIVVAQIQREAVESTIGIDPAEANALALQKVAAYLPGLLDQLMGTTERTIEEARLRYLATAGISDEQLLALLLAGFSPERAALIGITETTNALAIAVAIYGAWLATQGVKKQLVYRTAEDERVCPVCSVLDGKREGEVGFAYPPRHPMCRCHLVLQIR